jgi:hypothetical protein
MELNMELNAEHEFWTMIEELASDRGNIQERAVYADKRLGFLEPEHVPEALRGELQRLKSDGDGARSMSEGEAHNFVMKLLSFYGKLRASTS